MRNAGSSTYALGRVDSLSGAQAHGMYLWVLRGVPAEIGDGRRQCFAGCSREETSSLDEPISLSLSSSKGYRRELLLSLSLLSLDRHRLQSSLLRRRVLAGSVGTLSPLSHRAYSLGLRITGIRLWYCSSREFGSVVMTVKLSSSVSSAGLVQPLQRPANAKGMPPPTTNSYLGLPFFAICFHSKKLSAGIRHRLASRECRHIGAFSIPSARALNVVGGNLSPFCQKGTNPQRASSINGAPSSSALMIGWKVVGRMSSFGVSHQGVDAWATDMKSFGDLLFV